MGGKRSQNSDKDGKRKRHKVSGFIDPNTSGIYATCNRGKENQCRNELINFFSEKAEEYYGDLDLESDKEDKQELTIEEQIAAEVGNLKDKGKNKKETFKPIDLGCECLIFFKTRKPIQPAEFVQRICQECHDSKRKTTRYTQKLTPISFSVSPSIEELKKLAKIVLGPHFHKEEGQEPHKFAINVTRRNFNTLPKIDIIKTVAECVGREHGHSVDLKAFDKLILVECYKSNIGMSVVENYNQLERFNLQQIFDKNQEGAEVEAKSDSNAA